AAAVRTAAPAVAARAGGLR
ncbi:MAG: hypothetical protein AVDCRST_MAG07-1798, partial [uncultured Frankineae bacterium]